MNKLGEKIAYRGVITASFVLVVIVFFTYGTSKITFIPDKTYYSIVSITTLVYAVFLILIIKPHKRSTYIARITNKQHYLIASIYSLALIGFSFTIGLVVCSGLSGINRYCTKPHSKQTQTYAIKKYTISRMRSRKLGYNVYIEYNGEEASFEVPTSDIEDLKHSDSVTITTKQGCLDWDFAVACSYK